MSDVRPDLVTPTGVADADLLDLEFAEPTPEPIVTVSIPSVDPPTVELHPIGGTVGPPGCAGEHLLDHLNPEMVEFVGRMEMAFVGTADAGGECDSSFRAGPSGFLHVLDSKRIAYPEYRGNGVLASLGNISENPHVALLMIDFVRDLIGLHVNGCASIVDDAELRTEHPSLPVAEEHGRTPERWVVVHVEETYFSVRARRIAGHY